MQPLPDATIEMIKFVGEKNAINNENSKKRERIQKSLKKKRDEIAEALIGIGNSLKSLTEQKAEIEEKLAEFEKEYEYKDVSQLFMRKFGVNMYQINMSPKLTQKEIDSIKGDEEED